MQKKLVVASSPLIRDTSVSTRRLMGDVVIAMLPTALAAVWFFGAPALSLILVSVVSAVLSEAVYQRLTHQKVTIGDLSAVVTGMLLAFNIPANAPWWMAAIGSALAIILVKQMFGGLGQNFMNPALAARTILMLSWTGLMAATAVPAGGQLFGLVKVEADAVAAATPLVNSNYSLWQLFVVNYLGTEDPRAIELFVKKASVVGMMKMASTMAFSKEARSPGVMEPLMEMVRKNLLANAEQLIMLLSM